MQTMNFKIFYIIGILLFFAENLIAQEKTDTVKLWTRYPGFVITNDNDTLYGYLLLKNKISNQGKLFFFNSMDSEEPIEKYKPGDIKAYKVANRFYETVKFSPANTVRKYTFLLLVVDGPVKVYKSYFDDKERIKIDEDDIWNSKIDLHFSESELKNNVIGKRESEKNFELFDSVGYLMNFKKKMSEYLSDCPEIAKKIAKKEEGYQWINLEDIIREYNDWYIKNN